MFGIGEKEYERQKHEEDLKRLEAKALIFNTMVSNASDDIITIGKHALRKSFIHEVSKGDKDKVQGTWIYYFNFCLKGHLTSMTDRIFIADSEITFEAITKILMD